MRGVDAGIDPSNVLTFEVRPPSGTYPNDADKVQLVDALLSRIEALPGVLSAGAGRRLPYTGFAWSSDFSIEGWGPDEYGIEVRHREVTQGYFRTLGVPVVDGSPFPRQLGPDERVPVVVNQAFVDRYFPNDSPVGHRIAFDRSPDSTSYWYPIVGVVGSEGMDIVSGPQPEIISHLAGDTPNVMRFVVKTDVAPLSVVPAVRNELAQLDAEIPMVRVRTMEEVAGDALAADRFLMVLLGVFAAAALAMAAIGVYGVAAQAVRSRTREIGIRMALGASARDITRALIVRGLTFVGIGITLGIVGSALASGALRNLLFGVEPNDPLTLIGVAVVLAVVAISATVVPVWRAAQLDPARVLNLD